MELKFMNTSVKIILIGLICCLSACSQAVKSSSQQSSNTTDHALYLSSASTQSVSKTILEQFDLSQSLESASIQSDDTWQTPTHYNITRYNWNDDEYSTQTFQKAVFETVTENVDIELNLENNLKKIIPIACFASLLIEEFNISNGKTKKVPFNDDIIDLSSSNCNYSPNLEPYELINISLSQSESGNLNFDRKATLDIISSGKSVSIWYHTKAEEDSFDLYLIGNALNSFSYKSHIIYENENVYIDLTASNNTETLYTELNLYSNNIAVNSTWKNQDETIYLLAEKTASERVLILEDQLNEKSVVCIKSNNLVSDESGCENTFAYDLGSSNMLSQSKDIYKDQLDVLKSNDWYLNNKIPDRPEKLFSKDYFETHVGYTNQFDE